MIARACETLPQQLQLPSSLLPVVESTVCPGTSPILDQSTPVRAAFRRNHFQAHCLVMQLGGPFP
jgi:hypothetical protein